MDVLYRPSGYTVEKYMEVVNRIREKLPDAAVTADAIVGFPGETEEQFQNTLKLMEMVKFDVLNTAAYRQAARRRARFTAWQVELTDAMGTCWWCAVAWCSPRPNTPAALYEEQVPEDVKADRLQRINRYEEPALLDDFIV